MNFCSLRFTQMKLINRGRNVTVQSFDKQKQILAQMCWLLAFPRDHSVFGAVHARLECGPAPGAPRTPPAAA